MISKLRNLFSKRPSVVELWQSVRDRKWYFHLRAGNGRTQSPSQGYSTKSNAIRAARALFEDKVINTIDDPNA
jgi:hypothetical protein